MPNAGASARANQMATLAELAHQTFVADETGDLLNVAAEEVSSLDPDTEEASVVRVGKRDFDKARKVPSSLVAAIERHAGMAYPAWVEARESDNFDLFEPSLKETVRLSKELAEHLGYEEQAYDALLDQYEPGMKTSKVRAIFSDLKGQLVPLARAISERTREVDDAVIHRDFDEAGQESFGRMVAERLGYDFSRGRLDRAVHPFCTYFSANDVRLTTRYRRDYFNDAFFGIVHEAGHGMYGQGLDPSFEATPLADSPSLGLNESQSRMWENVVGRSRNFWQHFFPTLQASFPSSLSGVDLDAFYRAINKVEPSYIRVDADEVTYNLHIMIRFEMEQELIQGEYSISDAPEVWNEKTYDYLGLRPPSHSLGILQDVHWSGGLMGYFPTYTLGNILSVQLFDKAVRDIPGIPDQIAAGEFDQLRGWMTENIYRHGAKFEPNDLVVRATGQEMESHSYVRYLKQKYGEMYDLGAAT